ncbi:MAG: hypothetical protein E7652_03515 [Ruminococcaceae bacterium]|nr:hypothetical protein [Oscillospiraceae bacterium]
MKKYILLTIIILVVIITVGSFGIGNKFSFSAKYHSDPAEAIMAELTATDDFTIQNDIYTLNIDDYNSIYFALTDNDELLAAEMQMKDGKYYFTGGYALYYSDSLGDCTKDGKPEYTEIETYNEKGVSEGSFSYAVFFEEPKNIKNLNVINVKSEDFKPFWIITK